MLRPDRFADALTSVSLDQLVAEGTRGIILDLDNTLVAYGTDDLDPADRAWIDRALARDLRIVLLSNNFPDRVARVAGSLGIPGIAGALKPLPTAFWRALRELGTPRRATVVVGDQLFTDVLGAKLVGLRSILMTPIVTHDHGTTKILRTIERLIIGRRERT
ncbi:MAG: YqeG family HAD IIIA-type phosphatase [Vulcanimicrobiaceae bacterium]